MRLRRTELHKRVNGQLELRFDSEGLTSYAGLELIRRFFQGREIYRRVQEITNHWLPRTDFGAARLVMLVVTMLIVGCRRVRHLRYLDDDPVVARTCGLKSLPTPRSLGRWLGSFGGSAVAVLGRLNEQVAAEAVCEIGPARLTIDIDGSVVSTGLQVQGAERGFNPHHRKVPSYYPITAYEAQSGVILRVQNRPGNIHDGKRSLSFLSELFEQVDRSFGRVIEEYRMDGAFFLREVLKLLDGRRAEYAIKVPFSPWLGLKQKIAAQRVWQKVDALVSCFEIRHRIDPWQRTERIVIYRKRVAHESRKNFQLDLFDPDDGHYEYSAIATNKILGGPHLWSFMCGRGTHEKVYGELKNGFAFDSVPTQRYEANSAWQVLSVIAFNLVRWFQTASTAISRPSNAKRRPMRVFESIHTIRFELIHRAGRLIRPSGRATLDVGNNQLVHDRFTTTAESLDKAA